MRDADERDALLLEIEAHRREHPFVVVFIVAKAIHEARLCASASVENLSEPALRDLVVALRAYSVTGVLP